MEKCGQRLTNEVRRIGHWKLVNAKDDVIRRAVLGVNAIEPLRSTFAVLNHL
jgi:hypothetical protein